MLTAETTKTVYDETAKYWEAQSATKALIDRAKGKEIGHKLADWVDERTCAVLTLALTTKRQHGKGGIMPRSMGDIWIEDQRIYHPVNVKTGVVGAEGQPNLVSLKKVLDAFLGLAIDSYWLLFVKFAPAAKSVVPTVYLADMLDVTEFLTYDAGPGQVMLKASRFFDAVPSGIYVPPKTLSFADRVERLVAMLEDGDRRLRENRDNDLKHYKEQVKEFRRQAGYLVTPESQKGLNLK